MTRTITETIENNQNTTKVILGNDKNQELIRILQFGEKYQKIGEELKKNYWTNNRYQFRKELQLKEKHKEMILQGLSKEEKEILNSLNGITKEKFIKEYLNDVILYSNFGDTRNLDESVYGKYNYDDLKEGNIEFKEGDEIEIEYEDGLINDIEEFMKKITIKEGMKLNLSNNKLGEKGATIIANNLKLSEGVVLNLGGNDIGYKGALELSKLKLKEGVQFNLFNNCIGDEGADAISKMEVKEGILLNLPNNEIGEKGAKSISKMELKGGVSINLSGNRIGSNGAKSLSEIQLCEHVYLELDSCSIGDEGAKAISKIKLKERDAINLGCNGITDKGAQAIIDNLELKEGVRIDLSENNLSDGMQKKLNDWVRSYNDRGINCRVESRNFY